MPKFKVGLTRVEYYQEVFFIEAENKEEAQEKSWGQSGKWELVDEEEFTNHIFLIGEENA